LNSAASTRRESAFLSIAVGLVDQQPVRRIDAYRHRADDLAVKAGNDHALAPSLGARRVRPAARFDDAVAASTVLAIDEFLGLLDLAVRPGHAQRDLVGLVEQIACRRAPATVEQFGDAGGAVALDGRLERGRGLQEKVRDDVSLVKTCQSFRMHPLRLQPAARSGRATDGTRGRRMPSEIATNGRYCRDEMPAIRLHP
jgi:hypothetical protein